MKIELWRTVPDGAREAIPGDRCPRCGQMRVHRSRARNLAEKALRALTPFRSFTCASCHWRGWRVPVASVGPHVQLPSMPPSKRSRRSSIERKRDRRVLLKQLTHVMIAIVAALVAGSLFSRCQHDADALEIPTSAR
jgi:hypothetical protein